MVKDVLHDVEKQMKTSLEHFRRELGKLLKIPIPPLDEERRREIAKKVKKMLEDEKTALRNFRREAKEFIEELEKEKEIRQV